MVLEFHELEFFEKIAFKRAENILMELEFHELEYRKSGRLLLIFETVVDFHIFHLKVSNAIFADFWSNYWKYAHYVSLINPQLQSANHVN